MTDPELFKYDVRVRERMLRKGLVKESEVEKHLQALPDLEGKCAEFELKQPALRNEGEAAVASSRVAPGASASATASPEPAVEDDVEGSVDTTEVEDGWGDES